MKTIIFFCLSFLVILLIIGCTTKHDTPDLIFPTEIVDLGALVTEDLPERVMGSRLASQWDFFRNNKFEIMRWEFEHSGETISGSNSIFHIYNHGGPHVDAPNHLDLGEGIDSYQLQSFIGRLKVIDVSSFPLGRTVGIEEINQHDINPNDIVLIYTGYKPPQSGDLPHRIALTQKAAQYLAKLPVRAFGTDAYNVESNDNPTPVAGESAIQRAQPIHFEFLSRGIPIYEQLFNVDLLLGKRNMYFVGPPLNIKDGDGMIVRPVVLVFE